MKWVVYILECKDKSLYTGITNDLERRLEEHNKGTGAKYTKTRRPSRLRYTEEHDSRSAALKREAAIKSLNRTDKLTLIAARSSNERPEKNATQRLR
ncbi:GIY-YIG nuclease family protein [Nitrospira sp. NS4]|uniref:GIY-YIG nuclease family protein n=1 Tax=Nitrospira sp. NS4 TaxID=3414498 RepID=UPI003C2ACAC2